MDKNNNKDNDVDEKRQKQLDYYKAYYQKNKETKLKQSKENYYKTIDQQRIRSHKYFEEHKDEIKKKHHEYYESNKEKVKESNTRWHKNHLDRWRAYLKRRLREPAKYANVYDKFLLFYGEENMRRDPENNELIQFKCHRSGCDNWFNPTNAQIHDRWDCIVGRKTGDCALYCSDECKALCPSFNQSVWPKGFKINDREVQPELRELVLARDNYTCQHEGCNKSLAEFPDLKLHCHHIFPINEDPVCSADIDNCITLCEECHKWVHMNVPGCSYVELRCSKKEENNQ